MSGPGELLMASLFGFDICETLTFLIDNGNLKVHEGNHSSNKPFSCQYGDKKFYLSSNLGIEVIKFAKEGAVQSIGY